MDDNEKMARLAIESSVQRGRADTWAAIAEKKDARIAELHGVILALEKTLARCESILRAEGLVWTADEAAEELRRLAQTRRA